MAGTSGSSSSSTGSPCGACKFLRRKCAADCIFAPYFWSEQGPARFAAIHKVFGASNVSKLLVHVPVPDRAEAVLAIAYEAQARIRDPVYGCVAHIFALQQQVAYLQAQVMQMKAQLSQNYHIDHESPSSRINPENNQWPLSGSSNFPSSMSLDTIDRINSMQYFEKQSRDTNIDQRVLPYQPHSRKRPSQTHDLTDLQQLALRMMNNEI